MEEQKINEENVFEQAEEEKKQDTMFSEETVLQPEMLGMYLEKKDFINNEQKIKIVSLGKNRFQRYVLQVETQLGDYARLNISNPNYNQLLRMFGPRLSEWKDKEVFCVGKEWKGTVKRNGEDVATTGVVLDFYQ